MTDLFIALLLTVAAAAFAVGAFAANEMERDQWPKP